MLTIRDSLHYWMSNTFITLGLLQFVHEIYVQKIGHLDVDSMFCMVATAVSPFARA